MVPIIESGDKAGVGAFGIAAIIGGQFATYQGIYVMLGGKVEIVGKSICPHHRQAVAMTLAHFAHGVCRLRSELVLRCIRAILGSTVTDAVHRLEPQVLDRFNLHVHVGIE